MHTQNARKPLKKKNNNTQAYSTPGPGPGQARAGAWVPGPNWGCCKLAYYCFFMGFLHLGYAYALIGLEIDIRLDLISNVCIIIPDRGSAAYP